MIEEQKFIKLYEDLHLKGTTPGNRKLGLGGSFKVLH